MKKNIAIVAGGYSSEFGVSLKSAQGIYSFLDKDKYNLYIAVVKHDEWAIEQPNGESLPIDKNDFSFILDGEKIKIDYAYITIHGTPGEDGRLQGYFDMIGLPYSSCGALASTITFNKYVCNHYLNDLGIRIADSIHLFKNETVSEDEVVAKLGLPLFVKPNDGGSSFGVTKVKSKEELLPAIDKAFGEGNEVVIESFIDGTEITCGCYKIKGKEVIFPITEVVTTNEFFDYNAKYNGEVQEITPARIPEEQAERIRRETSKIYDILGAKGLIRVDYIIPSDGYPCLLEINTNPGMTATSFIPQQIRAAGLNITDVLGDIIDNELNK